MTPIYTVTVKLPLRGGILLQETFRFTSVEERTTFVEWVAKRGGEAGYSSVERAGTSAEHIAQLVSDMLVEPGNA
jgi:hypothetical protein